MFKPLITIALFLSLFSCNVVSVFSDADKPNDIVIFTSSRSLDETYNLLKEHLNKYKSPLGIIIISNHSRNTKKEKKLVTTQFKKSEDGNSKFSNDFYFVQITSNFFEKDGKVEVATQLNFYIKKSTNGSHYIWSKEAEIQKARYVSELKAFFEKL